MKKADFLKLHPRCCFCGETAEEEDHLPSRSCFDERGWPEGFSFPTCRTCNRSTSQDEQVVALYSRMMTAPDTPAIKKELETYMKGIFNNNPEIVAELAPKAADPQTGVYAIEIGAATQVAFENVLSRWARAFHYKETGIIVPKTANIITRMFTNADLIKGRVPAELFESAPLPVKRGQTDLSSQFSYSAQTENDGKVGMYVVLFRRSFGALLGVDFTGQLLDIQPQ